MPCFVDHVLTRCTKRSTRLGQVQSFAAVDLGAEEESPLATCDHTNILLGLTPIMNSPYYSPIADQVGARSLSGLKKPGYRFGRIMASVRIGEITSKVLWPITRLESFPDRLPFGRIHGARGLSRDLIRLLGSRVRGSFCGSPVVLCIAAFLDAEVGA